MEKIVFSKLYEQHKQGNIKQLVLGRSGIYIYIASTYRNPKYDKGQQDAYDSSDCNRILQPRAYCCTAFVDLAEPAFIVPTLRGARPPFCSAFEIKNLWCHR